jgi:hypothetical protein
VKAQYDGWITFKIGGRKFLALIMKTRNVHIYGEGFENFGSWMTVDSFKKRYKKEGQSLSLGRTGRDCGIVGRFLGRC